MTKPDAGHGEVAAHDERGQRARDDVHRGGRDEPARQVLQQIAVAHFDDLRRGGEVGRAREHEVVGVGREAVHERGRDAPVLLDVRVEGGELHQVLDEDRRGRADVEAHVDEARLRRRRRPVVVDDREHLVVAAVRQLGIDFVRVDEGEEVDAPDLAHGLDLPELEPQELHERAVLAVAELVAVADGRLARPGAGRCAPARARTRCRRDRGGRAAR